MEKKETYSESFALVPAAKLLSALGDAIDATLTLVRYLCTDVRSRQVPVTTAVLVLEELISLVEAKLEKEIAITEVE